MTETRRFARLGHACQPIVNRRNNGSSLFVSNNTIKRNHRFAIFVSSKYNDLYDYTNKKLHLCRFVCFLLLVSRDEIFFWYNQRIRYRILHERSLHHATLSSNSTDSLSFRWNDRDSSRFYSFDPVFAISVRSYTPVPRIAGDKGHWLFHIGENERYRLLVVDAKRYTLSVISSIKRGFFMQIHIFANTIEHVE